MKSKFTWIFTLLLAFFIQLSFAQEKTITGVVTDIQGMPIPGVTVKVVGATGGAVQTDFDGNFSIKASVNQKLEFSFVAMDTQVVTVGSANSYNVQLQGKEIGDVVITGYRSTTRPLATTAVTTITSKTIEGRPNANFIQTLQSQVPGLNISTGSGQPGSNSTVILRGYGTINGNAEPLYVIDGVPLTVDNFRSLNPNDIESISVLKDAGATAIYGNRGANGVIVVKTKKGSFESPLNIKYLGTTSYTTMQNNKYNKMNSRQLLRLEKNYGNGFGTTLTDDEINNFGTNTDWYDELFKTGVAQNHVISLTGGGKNLSSFTSLGYFNQDGILENTGLQRFSFRNNLNGRSNDNKFTYGTSLTINYSKRREANNLGTGNVNINPVLGANSGAPYISPSSYTGGLDLYNAYDQTGLAQLNGAGQGTLLLTPLMLLDKIKTSMFSTNELKMIGNFQANYKITDDLSIGTSFGSDFTENISLQVQDPQSFNSYLFQQGETYLGWQAESFSRDFSFNLNNSINYSKNFDKHTIEASAFMEYYKSHGKGFNYQQNGLDPKVFAPGNGAGFIGHNPFPTDDTGSPAFYVPNVGSSKSTAGLFSYFATADYDYDQKFGLGATVRRDATYRFSGDNRWGTFWSVSGRWNIDREKFMENSIFSLLKLRGSIGTSGNQNIGGQSIYAAPNLPRTLYALVGSGYQNNPSYSLSQIGNPAVKWETTKQVDIGVDFEAWKGRLRGNFDIYDKTTVDLFQSRPISSVNGTSEINGNNGKLQNRGVELLVSYDIVSTNDFKFTLNFNGSYNKNKVLDIPAAGGIQDEGLQVIQEGRPLLEYYAIRYAGVNPADGNLLFYTKDGQLTETPATSDRVLTGKTFFPKYQGGFGFETNYKGFFLTTQFSYVADIWRYDYDLEGLQDPTDIGVFNKSTDLLRAWTTDNRNTDIPSLTLNNKGYDADSDRYLKDASYVRLRFASIGYDFSKSLLEKTPFTKIRTYLQGENLFTMTKWRGWDAESSRAADQYQYPTPRIMSLGVEVEF